MRANQHFVPQFYLRGFASAGRPQAVSLFRISDGKYVPNASIKHQACRRDFYGEDDEAERAFSILEAETSRVFRRVRAHRSVPSQYSLDHQALLAFIQLQRKRTPLAQREFIESINKPLGIAFRDDPRFAGIGSEWVITPEWAATVAVGWSLWLWPLLLDLKCVLLQTDHSPGFITSDSPVIFYNSFLEQRRIHQCNTGMMSRGLVVIMPISPRQIVLLYDGEAYKVRHRFARVRVRRATDVSELNRLQLANADSLVYCDSAVDPEYMRGLTESVLDARAARVVTSKEIRSIESKTDSLIHTRSAEIRTGLELSFLRHRRDAVRSLDLSTAAVWRDPEMWDLMDEFLGLVEKGARQQEDLFMFLAEKGKLKRTPPSFRGQKESS